MAVQRGDITAGLNYGIDVLNSAAKMAASKYDDWIERTMGLKIESRVDFNDMNYEIMKKFMTLNINERDITLNTIGTDAAIDGDPTLFNGMDMRPSYADGNNYVVEYARKIGGSEKNGIDTTRVSYTSGETPYEQVTNLYPDQLNSGTFSNKWKIGNRNSMIRKTKKMFDDRKIKTLIERFCTDESGNSPLGTAGDSTTKYGMSHAKNLLKKSAEDGGGSNNYIINGYNNPYCRVWTHHYQFDKLYKLIRPFSKISDDGSYKSTTTLPMLHNWGGDFKRDAVKKTEIDEDGEKYTYTDVMNGWKSGNRNGWHLSSLDSNGFVRITPKYVGGGYANTHTRQCYANTHTRQCMFSIENLAWKGYDPYSFEKALSWEQRGPLGGRIMWFPPYNLTFNETTQANWSNSTFIGRGEDVYTYVNTVRSGTLSFIMLTDHPSVIDYANWYDNDGADALKDTDILRFFAGCDSGNANDPDSIYSKVKPTPLTDEYVVTTTEKEEMKYYTVTPELEEVPDDAEYKEIYFYVFFPNNYSGCYDMPSNSGNVHAIAYLLGGNGCNKTCTVDGKTIHSNNIPISFDNFVPQGNGYEMGNKGISNQSEQDANGNYIIGNSYSFYYNKINNKGNETYDPVITGSYTSESPYDYKWVGRKWFYRIDGKYEIPESMDDVYSNTYDQRLAKTYNYVDIGGFGLNKDAAAVVNAGFGSEEDIKDLKLFSFAEIAAAASIGTSGESAIRYQGVYDYLLNGSLNIDYDRVEAARSLFQYNKIKNVEVIGYSSWQANNSSNKLNENRNNSLAKSRSNTVYDWLSSCGLMNSYNTGDGFEHNVTFKSSVCGTGENPEKDNCKSATESPNNASSKEAKKWRSAKVTIKFAITKTESLSEAKSEEEGGKDVINKYKDYTYIRTDRDGFKRYKDANGVEWYEESKGILKRAQWETSEEKNEENVSASEIGIDKKSIEDVQKRKEGRSMLFKLKDEREETVNRLRYDQEYHFYKRMEQTSPIVFKKLTEKLKYFDPALHSMTPEGFTERLTFLNQCTRQGSTISASDHNGKTASNLAFGRPPFCVLRIGDFYYQTIVIDSINIDYNVSNGLVWDLNPEGNGVQPMLAQINISFKFIGGGDIAGPIRRLQNAMTFNYYANQRFSDNRADRVDYNWDELASGATNHDINVENSFAYETQLAK